MLFRESCLQPGQTRWTINARGLRAKPLEMHLHFAKINLLNSVSDNEFLLHVSVKKRFCWIYLSKLCS